MAVKESSSDIVIQERDLALLGLLLHARILTLAHATVLIFGGKKEAAKKRIQKLKADGLILGRRRKAYEQGVLFLSKKGFDCLKLHSALPAECPTIRSFSKRGQISELTLRHELEVLDVKTAFHREVGKHKGVTIAEFSTWPQLYEFSVRDNERHRGSKIVRPDGFIRIHERDSAGALWEHMFFLEVDRSTEKLETLAARVKHYNLFYRQGGMAKRYGGAVGDYQNYPFRILLICKTPQRVATLAEKLRSQRPAVMTHVLLSSLKEVLADPYGKSWSLPIDVSASPHRSSLLDSIS